MAFADGSGTVTREDQRSYIKIETLNGQKSIQTFIMFCVKFEIKLHCPGRNLFGSNTNGLGQYFSFRCADIKCRTTSAPLGLRWRRRWAFPINGSVLGPGKVFTVLEDRRW